MWRRSSIAVGLPGCPITLSPSRQVGLFRLSQVTEMPCGCPIAAEQTQHVPLFPQRRANERKEPAKAVVPVRKERQITQEQIDQQGGPHLPAHRIGGGAEKIRQLQGLFDLFEEDFDLPAA